MIINGLEIRNNKVELLTRKIQNINKKLKLVIILIGNNYASEKYVNNKQKLSKQVGIDCVIKRFDDISEVDLLKIIEQLNQDNSVNGILVQLPLPKTISTQSVVNQIDPLKDVDGFSNYNIGNLTNGFDGIKPCTPLAIVEMLDSLKVNYQGLNVLIAGRSNIVGKPLAVMLINLGATVTVVNSKTKNIKAHIQLADVFISAIGKPKYFDSKYFVNKQDLIVIDVGINQDQGGKLCGDVDFEEVKEKVYAISPVPGGVGPLTVFKVLENLVKTKEIKKEIR